MRFRKKISFETKKSANRFCQIAHLKMVTHVTPRIFENNLEPIVLRHFVLNLLTLYVSKTAFWVEIL